MKKSGAVIGTAINLIIIFSMGAFWVTQYMLNDIADERREKCYSMTQNFQYEHISGNLYCYVDYTVGWVEFKVIK